MTVVANIELSYPWPFFFPAGHYAVSFVVMGALLIHLTAKWGTASRVLRRPGTVDPELVGAGSQSPSAGVSPVARRRFLTAVGAASAGLVAVTIGQTIAPLKRFALGERLANGFSVLGPGIIVGMETPHAMHALVDGVAALARGLDVLGPALDGGYWSIELARSEPGVFSGIEISTDHTGADQLERMQEPGRNVHLLPMARDIDTFDDVRALAETHLGGHAMNSTVAHRFMNRTHWLRSTSHSTTMTVAGTTEWVK